MRRWSLKVIAALVAVFALLYAGDALVLMGRVRSGVAHSTITVNSSYVIHQKNGKLEYLYDPPQATSCVRSIFPHQGQPACWWLAKHTDQQKDITAN